MKLEKYRIVERKNHYGGICYVVQNKILCFWWYDCKYPNGILVGGKSLMEAEDALRRFKYKPQDNIVYED